jgi:hypothetical protein
MFDDKGVNVDVERLKNRPQDNSRLQTTNAEKVDLGGILDTIRSKVVQNLLLRKFFGLSDKLADFLLAYYS